MPWWAWIVVGAILFGSELTFVDAQFYLIFCGSAALLVGLLGLGGVAMAEWLQWLVFATLSVASLVFFRRRLYGKLRRQVAPMATGPVGDTLVVPVELAPHGTCRVEYRGSTWTARNVAADTVPAGAQVRIVNVDGLILQVRSDKT